MKTMAPIDARGTDAVCRLRTDHHDINGAWILTDGYQVSIRKQESGKSPTESISLNKRDFDLLVRWYLRQQTLRER
jgi:hypothetical protein